MKEINQLIMGTGWSIHVLNLQDLQNLGSTRLNTQFCGYYYKTLAEYTCTSRRVLLVQCAESSRATQVNPGLYVWYDHTVVGIRYPKRYRCYVDAVHQRKALYTYSQMNTDDTQEYSTLYARH